MTQGKLLLKYLQLHSLGDCVQNNNLLWEKKIAAIAMSYSYAVFAAALIGRLVYKTIICFGKKIFFK